MLNYKQLYYFWNVAKYGGVTRAAEQLHVTPQTISGQISELTQSLGTELFLRSGRRLKLTPAGELAFSLAEDIFRIGANLEALVKGHQREGDLLFRVGVSDVIPKTLAYQLLAPAIHLPEPVRLKCVEDRLELLFADLAIHNIDLVIADRPLHSDLDVKGFSHLLGESATAFYGTPELVHQVRQNFPQSLDGMPMLLPGPDSAIRPALERWFSQHNLAPRIKGEFDDSGLMKAFGQEGYGLFPAPQVIEAQVARQHGVAVAGVAHEVVYRYYAISVERQLRHPAVVAISQSARNRFFKSVGKE